MRIDAIGGAYHLIFDASPTYAGTASLGFTLSNVNGVSAPGDITLRVGARPDPLTDADVTGMIESQARTAQGFASSQIANFSQRLEQLHSGAPVGNAYGVNVGLQQSSASAYVSPTGAGGEAVQAIGAAAPSDKSVPALADGVFGDLALWSGGFVKLGTDDNGWIDLESTLVGISGGADYRFSSEFAAGLGFGYGRDVTNIGSSGTRNTAEAVSMAVYGSYRPVPGFFVDGMAGYGVIAFDSQRYVAATGDMALGRRLGDQLFGAMTFGYEYVDGGLRLSPYGRISASRSILDPFSETGAGLWNLAYGGQMVDSLTGILGFRIEYDIPTEWGLLTPRARLEYGHDFMGASATSLGYADIGSLPYLMDVDGLAHGHVLLELGIDARLGHGATIGLDYGTSFETGGNERSQTLSARMAVQF